MGKRRVILYLFLSLSGLIPLLNSLGNRALKRSMDQTSCNSLPSAYASESASECC